MKFKLFSLAALMSALMTFSSFAKDIFGGKDPLEVTYIKDKPAPDPAYQQELRESAPWKSFLATHGNWFVEFNESTGKPHRAYGKPIQGSGNTPEDVAMAFITTQLSGFNFDVNSLRHLTTTSTGKYDNVFYEQEYQGLQILNSRVMVKMTKDRRINLWSLDVYDVNIDIVPTISEPAAIAAAGAGITTPVTNSPLKLKVLPIPAGRSVNYHLVYELMVETKNENNLPAKYYTLVDAHSGSVLYRQNKVMFSQSLNSDVTVTGTVYPINPHQPSAVVPLRNLLVDGGGNSYYTDSLGNASLTGTAPVSTTFSLQGLWSKVVTDQGNISPQVTIGLNAGANTVDFDPVASIRHLSAYYHVNIVHDFMKGYFPSFTTMDNPLMTRVDVTSGSCNAFYDGSSINFYEASSGCHCMSQVGDIVYHEYGHGINDKFYQSLGVNWDNGAMHEGYADVWGMSITQSPILGAGYTTSGSGSFIRRYDVNRKVYPDDITGESHDDGEIIAGAWYDVSVNIGSWSTMTTMFAETFFDLVTGPDGDEGQIFTDILISALNADDDDGDLTNGTPNDNAIIDAFDLHGISLLNNATLAHNEVLTASSLAPGIDIHASLASQFPWISTAMTLNYRLTNSGTYTSIPMNLNGPNDYMATIPSPAPGTIISYYLELTDGVGNSIRTLPDEAAESNPNIPYYILVDCIRERIEDFDQNQSPGWQAGLPADNATSGEWEIGPPMVSLANPGDTCQPGVQYTFGGANCAVTGNASSPASPIGNNDIDGGRTTLQSPAFDISNLTDPVITYWRWYTNDQGSTPRTDSWQTFISADGTTFVPVEDIDVPDHSWRRFAFKVFDYIPGASSVTLRFVGEDAGQGSLVEAAVDEIEFYDRHSGVSIAEISTEDLVVYPNPAGSELSFVLTTNTASPAQVKVYNVTGQIVEIQSLSFSTGLNRKSVDTSRLQNGIYTLVLESEDFVLSRPFTVLQ